MENLYPKELACLATEYGVWSKIIDDGSAFDTLTSYYQLFALGLGDGSNRDFVAWVEPYVYSTSCVLGTSASAPVYDTSRNPPLFIGVVSIHFAMTAFENALGVPPGSHAAIDQIVATSYAVCPSLNLTTCVLESYRLASSNESVCRTGNCSARDFVQVEATQCLGISDYPTDLWANKDFESRSYEVGGALVQRSTFSRSHSLSIYHSDNMRQGTSLLCSW